MIHKIILGTAQLGLDYGIHNQSGKPSLEEAFDILHLAHDSGIRMLDTAEAYGNSQEVIGLFHIKFPQKTFQIITKLAANQFVQKGSLPERIKSNCAQLHVQQLYCYMFHNYDSYAKSSHLYEELAKAKQNGLVKKIGISLYTNEEIEAVLNSDLHFDVFQIPFNLLDNSFKRQEILGRAKKQGVEIHTRSAFLQGVFFYKYNELPSHLTGLKPYLAKLQNLELAKETNVSTLALQYALQKDFIDYVLFGVETSDQLRSNLQDCSVKLEIPHKEIDWINVKEEHLLNPSNWNS